LPGSEIFSKKEDAGKKSVISFITYYLSPITYCLFSSFWLFGHWNLGFIWNLVLGIWNFRAR